MLTSIYYLVAAALLASTACTSVFANPLQNSQQKGQPRENKKVTAKASLAACSAIAKAGIPVFYPGQNSTCVVEPDTPQKVGKILKIVATLRVPFAVQSGGHAINPGFSSTKGVHISMRRFNHLKLAPNGLTVDTGLKWGEVYAALEGTGRTAVGGRVSPVGVGGFLMYGGGYSFHSSQYGLGVDQILEYTLVLPDGEVKKVTAKSDGRLFNALKGSGNNFGIVTSFKLKTVPSTQVWGGAIVYTADKFPQINAAVSKFSVENKDPKASLLAPYTALLPPQSAPLILLQMFYDGPTPPIGIFDEILKFEALMVYPGFGTRNFTDLIRSIDTEVFAVRNYYQPVPVRQYTPRLLQAITDLTLDYALSGKGVNESGLALSIAVEPFSAQAFTFSSGQEAYLHDSKHGCLPTNVLVTWTSPSDDKYWHGQVKEIASNLTALAIEEGQDLKDCPLYPNYSLFDNPLEKIYGDNLPRLRKLQNKIDPFNVMGLAGGFKL